MILTTKVKIGLAALPYRAIAIARAIGGRGNTVIAKRGGLRWNLDLREGIDFSIYLLGAFERSTVATLQKLVRPGNVIFDIGANIGAHTLGLARSAGPQGRVYAFEPAASMFEKLQGNLKLNPELQSRTQVRQLLFAAHLEERLPAQIYASWPLVTEEIVHPKLRGRLVDTSGARVDTLDNFVEREGIQRLDLIKIDVDGHEYPVLRGGAHTLARFQPILLMEMSPYVQDEQEHGFAALVDLLKEMQYSLYEAGGGEPLPLDAGSLRGLIPDGASLNAIARPRAISVRQQEIKP